MKPPRSVASGFTLLEIMIALGVFAVLSLTIHGRIGDVLRQGRSLEERTLATWVAQNRMAALTLEHRGTTEDVATGNDSALLTLAGRGWRVETTIASTSDVSLRRVEIEVRPDTTIDAREGGATARLIGFVGRY